MLYALGLGGLCLLPWQSPAQLLASVRRIEVSAWLLGLSLGPTLGAYALLGTALERLPASVVSIVATLEPVIAAVLAWALLGQTIAPLQIVGGAGVLTSVLILRHAHDAGTPRGSQKQA